VGDAVDRGALTERIHRERRPMWRVLIRVLIIIVVASLILWALASLPIDATLYAIGRVVTIVVAVIAIILEIARAAGVNANLGP
jgi:hypothetical protein